MLAFRTQPAVLRKFAPCDNILLYGHHALWISYSNPGACFYRITLTAFLLTLTSSSILVGREALSEQFHVFILVTVLISLSIHYYFVCMYVYVQALRLISELCLYYHVRDPALWTNLLEQLLNLEMVTEQSLHHRKVKSLMEIQLQLPYLRHVMKVLASLSGHSSNVQCPTANKSRMTCFFVWLQISSLASVWQRALQSTFQGGEHL